MSTPTGGRRCRRCSRARARRPVPDLTCVAGNGGVPSSGGQAQGCGSIQRPQAKGKTGRVNTREPSMMLRCGKPADGMVQVGSRHWPLGSGRRRPGTRCRSGEHRRPRGREGTHPVVLARVEGGNPVAVRPRRWCGRYADRTEGPTPQRANDDQKRTPARRKATGNRDEGVGLHRRVADNWPDTGGCPTRKGADRSQVSPWRERDSNAGTDGHVRHDPVTDAFRRRTRCS